MDNVIIFLFFFCIFILAIFVVNIVNRLEKIEKENDTNSAREINELKIKVDYFYQRFARFEKLRFKPLEDKVNNYKPYNDAERKEICKAIEQDMINTLKNINNFIQGGK